jgi:hypothetical protein
VPQPFIKTKAIVHGLVDNNVAQPQGWCASFADKVRNVVLPGYTVFSADDARLAVKSLLETSQAVRLKRPLGATGLGQQVIGTRLQLEQFLESYSASELSTYGLVIEMNIREVRTLNVGQITIGGKTVSYYGTQAMTQNNEGATVYGGSNLICVRGGWSSLDALTMSPDIRAAVNKALAFDRAADDFPGILLSRRNYDVGVGFDESGHRRSGVFEQSWRFGGASTAELAAMAAFNEEADVQIVHVSTVKRFGKECKCPRGAIIHYRGDDPIVGPMIRYTVVTKVVRLGHFHQKLNGSFS